VKNRIGCSPYFSNSSLPRDGRVWRHRPVQELGPEAVCEASIVGVRGRLQHRGLMGVVPAVDRDIARGAAPDEEPKVTPEPEVAPWRSRTQPARTGTGAPADVTGVVPGSPACSLDSRATRPSTAVSIWTPAEQALSRGVSQGTGLVNWTTTVDVAGAPLYSSSRLCWLRPGRRYLRLWSHLRLFVGRRRLGHITIDCWDTPSSRCCRRPRTPTISRSQTPLDRVPYVEVAASTLPSSRAATVQKYGLQPMRFFTSGIPTATTRCTHAVHARDRPQHAVLLRLLAAQAKPVLRRHVGGSGGATEHMSSSVRLRH